MVEMDVVIGGKIKKQASRGWSSLVDFLLSSDEGM